MNNFLNFFFDEIKQYDLILMDDEDSKNEFGEKKTQENIQNSFDSSKYFLLVQIDEQINNIQMIKFYKNLTHTYKNYDIENKIIRYKIVQNIDSIQMCKIFLNCYKNFVEYNQNIQIHTIYLTPLEFVINRLKNDFDWEKFAKRRYYFEFYNNYDEFEIFTNLKYPFAKGIVIFFHEKNDFK